jgi:predicted nucleotidyltransferase
MNRHDILKNKREEILDITNRYGAKNIRLFGSILREEIKEKNDIDFLVEMEKGRSLIDIIAIKQDLEDLFGCKVDVVTDFSLSPYIRDEVLRQAINL